MNKVDYLVIADSKDFTSDYITIELNKRNKNYLRINRDKFNNYKIEWDVLNGLLKIDIENTKYIINKDLKGVYYRAPVYIRYYSENNYKEQLYKSQWMAFVKNIICFDDAKWINNPVDTYKAENKMLQLRYANEIGFLVPKTIVINSPSTLIKREELYAVKSIDTLFLRSGTEECFLYTNMLSGKDINNAELSLAPLTVQELISPKVDLRITVIKNNVYSVKVVKNNTGISDDWRKEKDGVEFIPISIPKEIEDKCIKLVQKLGLKYGAIDMAFSNNNYYFIEINPTGEWAWLVETAKFPIYKDIVDVLTE